MRRHTVVKDPNFPMKHAQITDLKDTKRIAEEVQDADIMIIRNGETVGYLVNPAHYEALVEAATAIDQAAEERFYQHYAQRHDGLERLDEAYAGAQRGERATSDEVARVFGKRA